MHYGKRTNYYGIPLATRYKPWGFLKGDDDSELLTGYLQQMAIQ